jgi:transcriptional regulator with XRE-family HTH domain
MSKHSIAGEFLKNARLRAGLSQRDVADHLKYQSPQYVSNWERGLTTPPGRTLRKLADLYQIPAEELYEVILEHMFELTRESLHHDFFGKRKSRA